MVFPLRKAGADPVEELYKAYHALEGQNLQTFVDAEALGWREEDGQL